MIVRMIPLMILLLVVTSMPINLPDVNGNIQILSGMNKKDQNTPENAEIDSEAVINNQTKEKSGQIKKTLHSQSDKIKRPWPTGALLRSAIFPGWGQIYNRKYLKAAFYGGIEIYLIYGLQKSWREMNTHQDNFLNSEDQVYKSSEFALYEESRDRRNVFLWLGGLTIFVSMFDAYVDAHFADFNKTDKAFEVKAVPRQDAVVLTLNYNFR